MRFQAQSRFFSRFTAVGFGLCGLLPSALASAQQEAEKPAPNILLLVDTSGSMEFQTDGALPTCAPGDTTDGANTKSRWINMVEVLTGTFNDYSCWAQDRNSVAFRDEFTLGSTLPYDFGYGNPYHRALSNRCTYGPGVRPPTSAPFTWPDRAVNTFEFSGGSLIRPATGLLGAHPGCSGFTQNSDGLLDIYRQQVRFGLMTFDTRINAGTGLTGTSADDGTGMSGAWSYYLGTPVTGRPANCSSDLPQEIGARNAAAPPWEGRMVAFGPADGSENDTRNEWIQDVLLSTRPYGATPIAGLLHDAREFLWFDTTQDPLNVGQDFGPSRDPSWLATDCRKTIVILLTDGEPNLDLRPSCEENPPGGIPGQCPYEEPTEIVSALRLAPPSAGMAVETYVIGFALGTVTPSGGTAISCSELTSADCSNPANADPGDEESKRIQACCTLNEIAAAGGLDENDQPRQAYFANNATELRNIFAEILDDVVQVATRTMPVFGSPGGDTTSSGFKFFSAFDPQPDPAGPRLWEGVLQRTRMVCSDATGDLVATPEQDELDGDDFGVNLVANQGSDRRFYTFLSSDDRNRRTLRPKLTAPGDGLAAGTGDFVEATSPSQLVSRVTPEAMAVTASTCDGASSDLECRNLILEHLVGITNAQGYGRCTSDDTCSLLGGIYHSTPQIVPGRPEALLRDDSYRSFVEEMAEAARPSVLYTSTVDGFLHAFDLAPFPGSSGSETRRVDSVENNELWAFIPPAVLPVLQNQYPSTPAILLDGLPVIKDVVASEEDPTVFERLEEEAQAGAGRWRTVLVQGFGSGMIDGGYFALDITEPDPDPDLMNGDPAFLWQITQDGSGNPLFGNAGTPLITTVFLGTTGEPGVEVPIAVLPGGDASPSGVTAGADGNFLDVDPPSFTSNGSRRAYVGREAARSLTIVRLDTGEVLKTFRPVAGAFSADAFAETNIPAPLVGQPVAFPATAGSVAERIFVGDRDGRLWRLDVSSDDVDDWTLDIFFDAFWSSDADDRQPVALPPVISTDSEGQLAVMFATGDQEATVGGASMINRVVSLTEELDELNNFRAHVNWVQTLNNGLRVTGPMVLFNEGLYYAVSRPPDTSSALCDVGQSQVFGTHFVLDAQLAANANAIPSPLSGPGPAPGASSTEFTPIVDGLIFGVSLDAEPTCTSAAEEISGDEGFGYGTVMTSRTVTPGRRFLSFEISGSGEDPRGVAEIRQELTTPRLPVTFESFAIIYQ